MQAVYQMWLCEMGIISVKKAGLIMTWDKSVLEMIGRFFLLKCYSRTKITKGEWEWGKAGFTTECH